ncbi:hypothetical protein [Streptomyces sp. NPDC015125]|uniref:hypothetical protein n=1 Tax=Streptomyces sp. NPDC015125 TaxID=3364938 RepID=UPI0036FBEC94
MARLQILELPEGAGDDRPPFILVIDQAPQDENSAAFREDLDRNRIAEGIGARHVLVFEDTISIPANDIPVDPDGHPIKVHVEGEFEKFREQVQAEVAKAQAELKGTLR